MDNVAGWIVQGTVSLARLVPYKTWERGERLKILLVGYNGKRNTGADVRVVEMVRQFKKILGEDHVEISIPTMNIDSIRVYYDNTVNLIKISTIYFKDLLDFCSKNQLSVISEGSTLKSQFANALTLYFCEAAGIMKKQNKPCIAYGSEAGRMDNFIRKIASKTCSDTYFIARTEASLKIINELGLKGHIGTDTAWTFPPAPKEWAERELRQKAKWDGKKPLVGIAVIDPWSYPVKPSILKTLRAIITRNWENHYDKIYFFTASERQGKYPAYLKGIADAVNRFRAAYDVHPIVIGMDSTDFDACNDLNSLLDPPSTVFSSRFYDGHQLTSILQSLDLLVTSRYHARVLSMAEGVPAIAVSLDERLYNLFNECNQLEDYYLKVDEPELGEKLLSKMEKLWENRDHLRREWRYHIPIYLKTMADMGKFFRGFVEESFPGIKLAEEPKNWLGYLPELYESLKTTLEDDIRS